MALRKNDAKGNYLSVDLTMYKAQLIKIRIDTPASGHKGSYVLTENYTAPDCVNAGSSKQALLKFMFMPVLYCLRGTGFIIWKL